MSLAEDIVWAAERNVMAMPAELREDYRSAVPSGATLWPLAVLLAAWYERQRSAGGVDVTPYWGVVDTVAKMYPMLDVFVQRAKAASSDTDVYAAGAVYALLIKAVGVPRLRLLLSQPILERIKAAVPYPRALESAAVQAPLAPERARRLSESPIRRFDAPRFTSGRPSQASPLSWPSAQTPTDEEVAPEPVAETLPEPDSRTITAGVLALRGWKPEEVEAVLKGKGQA